MSRWPSKPLGEVCLLNPRREVSDGLNAKTEVTFVPMAAIDQVQGVIDKPESRLLKEVAKGYTSFEENDILFAKITPCMQNGKAAIARKLNNGMGFGSTEFHVLRPTKDVLPEWIFAFIRQPSFRATAEENFTGTAGQQRVPTDFLRSYPIPVPPLTEQERLVKLLDEADALRQLRAQADQRTAALIPALFHEMFGDPANNPKNWPIETLEELFDITSSKRVFERDWKSHGVPFYRTRELVKLAANGHVDNELFISEEMYRDYSAKYGAPKEGDIMVSGVGTLGICYVVKQGDKFYFKDGNIIWLKKRSDTNSLFIEAAFQTDFVQNQIHNNSAGATVGTYTIVRAKKTRIALPPLALQKEFAARVAEIRALETAQTASRQRLDAFFQSLLHRAFQGEL